MEDNLAYLVSIVLFAIASSVTPGPNNVLVMTSGVNYGFRASLPLLSGICIGFTAMLVLVGFGFAQLFKHVPQLHTFIQAFGVMYLLYLVWLIAKSTDNVHHGSQMKLLSFMNGALFQWVNGKAWVVAMGALAAFSHTHGNAFEQHLVIATIFLLVSFPCVGVWLIFGHLLKDKLADTTRLKTFNYVMASLLVLSVLPIVIELVTQLSH